MTTIPNPGSKEAREQGCLCPVIDNEFGKGYLGRGDRFGFIANENCPLHGAGTVGSAKPWSFANQFKDVAKKLGINESSLSRILHGHRTALTTKLAIDELTTQEDLKQHEETMKKLTYTQDAIDFTIVKYIKQDWRGQTRNIGCLIATLVQLTNDVDYPCMVAIGVSLCNSRYDKFDKKIARHIALGRAKNHHKEYKLKNKYLYDDFYKAVYLSDVINEFILRCMRYYRNESIIHPKIIFV